MSLKWIESTGVLILQAARRLETMMFHDIRTERRSLFPLPAARQGAKQHDAAKKFGCIFAVSVKLTM